MTKPNPSDWIFFADGDLAIARDAMGQKLYHIVCFHAQQAVEKMLKAYLVKRDGVVPKTHALADLYQRIVTTLSQLQRYETAIEVLDRYYTATRYPDVLPGSLEEGLPTEQDARQAIADAKKLSAFIHTAIEKK